MNLGLEDDGATEILGYFKRYRLGSGYSSSGHRDSVFAQNGFGLVFMDLHENSGFDRDRDR